MGINVNSLSPTEAKSYWYDYNNGNTKGISALVAGMKAEDVIRRCEGITCGFKPTSCPDQLSHALREALAANR